ncbi:MAG: glycerol kinase [Spirochaetaceae bacterium]|nr:MAG: glycerol kinase [Spirochaetaceae bacterium]
MDKKYVMAVDQGTTGTRVILFTRDGRPAASSYEEVDQIYPHPGWVEHDPQQYYEGTRRLMQNALQECAASLDDVAAIGITCQRETTVLWDRETGQPLWNAIVWMCRRSAGICEELKAAGYEQAVREKTGLFIDPYFSGSKIKWILDNVPDARRRAEAGTVCMGTVDSWLMWKLSGGRYHVTDFSNASRTMLLNIHSLEWDSELLDALTIPHNILPQLMPSSGVMAYTDEAICGTRVPFAGDAGDQHAATFGQACFEPGMVKNTYGTGLALMMNIGAEPKLSTHGLTTNLGWHVDGQVDYALEGVIFTGGASTQWLRDGIKIIHDVAESESLATQVPDTGGVYLVPAFTGLCAPYWDMYARGVIVGITRGTSQQHIARAALEAIAYQTRDIVESMEADSGRKMTSLRVDGGATKNNFLMQFQADILDTVIERPAVTEMAALGAAYLAGLGVGFWRDKEELSRNWRLERVFEPRMNQETREQLYAGWKEAVSRSLGWAKKVALAGNPDA